MSYFLFTPFDDLNNLSQDDGDEEAMLNLVESLDEDYEENFIYVFPESINIMEILDELCNRSCETVVLFPHVKVRNNCWGFAQKCFTEIVHLKPFLGSCSA
jgi:hypothetical protein